MWGLWSPPVSVYVMCYFTFGFILSPCFQVLVFFSSIQLLLHLRCLLYPFVLVLLVLFCVYNLSRFCLYCSSNLFLLLLKFSNERNGRKCKWVWWWMVVMEKLEDMKKMLSDVNIQCAIIYAVLFVKRLLSSSGWYSLFNKNNSIIEVRCGKLKPTFYSTHFWWFWSIN